MARSFRYVVLVLPYFISGAPEPAVAQNCDPATNAQAVAEAREGIQNIRNFMNALQNAGLPVPPQLSGAVNRLTRAAELGVDFAEAAGEADAQIQRIVANKKALCIGDPDDQIVCEARIDRQWQARNVDGVLNWNNTGSVIRRAAAKWAGSRCDRSQGNANSAPRAAPISPYSSPTVRHDNAAPPHAPDQRPIARPAPTTPTPAARSPDATPRYDTTAPRAPDQTGPRRESDIRGTPGPGPGGIKIEIKPEVSRDADLSGIKDRVLRMQSD